MEDLFNKRSFLINDYISQILVYGSNTKGNINLVLEDDIILTVSVIKNSYFRYHNLGIKHSEYFSFYTMLLNDILVKFESFDIRFGENNLLISSRVNNNEICVTFMLNDEKNKKWFDKVKKSYYNDIK